MKEIEKIENSFKIDEKLILDRKKLKQVYGSRQIAGAENKTDVE